MSYVSIFYGNFEFSRPLSSDEIAYLKLLGDPDMARRLEPSAPRGYSQWEATEDGAALHAPEPVRSFFYEDWLDWLIAEVFPRWDVQLLDGYIDVRGEGNDWWTIVVEGGRQVE